MSAKVGDQVFITDFYRAKYPFWKESQTSGQVLKVISSMASLEKMNQSDYDRFLAKYPERGKSRQFPLISYLIQLGNEQYLVSEFGFEPK